MDDFTAGAGRREAVLTFTISDYRFVQPGDFVRCALTGVPIQIQALRYWNADVQEAYATPDAMLQRHQELAAAGGTRTLDGPTG
ncbi:MAG: DUF2093 domain-containing protein [Alphaproteobacteria bacterium]